MKKYRVGIIGATGMVGQRFLSLLEFHPWFEITILAASSNSAGKKYGSLMQKRWNMPTNIDKYRDMIVYDAARDMEYIAKSVDFIFSAVDIEKQEIIALEEGYARLECPVISNNSATRWIDDIPMIIPEINPNHLDIIATQRKRLNTKRGFIAVKSNCSLQSYLPPLHALWNLGIEKVLITTYQAISGAGKTFDTFPEIQDNIIPYISNEEEKSNTEPLKIWGEVQDGKIVNNNKINITSQCLRVPVSDGHLAAVFFTLKNKVGKEEIIRRWEQFTSIPQQLDLPSAPKKTFQYFSENDRPQTRIDRNYQNGMGISIGRLRQDTQYDYKFISLSHNTIRGAAGGAILTAELLVKKGYI